MKTKKRQPISVIIPTYNGLAFLKKNLPAVVKELQLSDELLIIDDAGSDDSLEWCHTYLAKHNVKQFQLIRNEVNLRFAASCNKAVKMATRPLVLLLNNDVSPHRDCFNNLVSHFDDQKLFAVGCKEIESKLQVVGGKNMLWFERGLFVHSRATNFTSGPTAWVSGGSGLFDRQKWLELGGFDLSFYPAYWEDVDLSFRAQQKGWITLFDENAMVDHNHESTNITVFGASSLEVLSFQHSLTFLWKHANTRQRLLFWCWLPYHLTITNLKSNGTFGKAWWRWLWLKEVSR